MTNTGNDDDKIISKPHPPRPENYTNVPDQERALEQYELDKAEYLAYLASRGTNTEKPKTRGSSKAKELITLYLTTEGDLYQEPKDKYCYSMLNEKERQKILRYFIKQAKITTGFIKTVVVAGDFNKSEQSIRTEIGKINSHGFMRLKIGRKVKMKDGRERIDDGLIDSKQGSGYRLNPKVKVIPK